MGKTASEGKGFLWHKQKRSAYSNLDRGNGIPAGSDNETRIKSETF